MFFADRMNRLEDILHQGYSGPLSGQFQGSNTQDFSSGAVTLYAIDAQPASGTLTIKDIANTDGFRYVRHIGPVKGFCNAAEIQFYGYPTSK
jgi:hypothetical protein